MSTSDEAAYEAQETLQDYLDFVQGEQESLVTGEPSTRGKLPMSLTIEAWKIEDRVIPVEQELALKYGLSIDVVSAILQAGKNSSKI